jgi:CBS domain-containing protein
VDYVEENATIGEALDAMEKHNYTAIPIISRNGKYSGTIGEGDILRYIKENNDFVTAKDVAIKNVKRNKDNSTVNVNSKFENLIKKAINQNFVPVVDDDNKLLESLQEKILWNNGIKNIRKNGFENK